MDSIGSYDATKRWNDLFTSQWKWTHTHTISDYQWLIPVGPNANSYYYRVYVFDMSLALLNLRTFYIVMLNTQNCQLFLPNHTCSSSHGQDVYFGGMKFHRFFQTEAIWLKGSTCSSNQWFSSSSLNFSIIFSISLLQYNIIQYILPDGIIEDIREFFQIEDSHFKHFYTKPFK